jgi:hypothetical protein
MGTERERPSAVTLTVNAPGGGASSMRPTTPAMPGAGTSSMQYRSRLGPSGAGGSHGRPCAVEEPAVAARSRSTERAARLHIMPDHAERRNAAAAIPDPRYFRRALPSRSNRLSTPAAPTSSTPSRTNGSFRTNSSAALVWRTRPSPPDADPKTGQSSAARSGSQTPATLPDGLGTPLVRAPCPPRRRRAERTSPLPPPSWTPSKATMSKLLPVTRHPHVGA